MLKRLILFLKSTIVEVTSLKKRGSKKVLNTYPKMEELIENNLVNIGDEVYSGQIEDKEYYPEWMNEFLKYHTLLN